ncbi:alpha/beta fold hydrolase [Roseateles sp. DAIF2]|uniref:alpha/beta fold hydrolase n=1 Tax=Roseateles sp. DAIF2 TaxID=2714952 RepID=UPI0018A302CC|nr:alpha/beta fold hydrolase [Roseateles sp. DAIF2]QPF72053.1 alpha/beta fold hydrolase [Roseateles sp. DAIF2]
MSFGERPAPSAEPSSSDPSSPATALRWLSEPLEQLLADGQTEFDILIIGSGYGGAAAAEHFSRCRGPEGQVLRIAVLERGREYLPGAFPERMADLPGHVRFASSGSGAVRGYRESLFDFRVGPDMCVALASGLGGGSLINAGVMEPARPEVFAGGAWPEGIRRDPGQMAAWYERAGRALGSLDANGAPNTIERLAPVYAPRRAEFMHRLDPARAKTVPITVALDERPLSPAGLDLNRCVACGDCATGCNHGAKQSLDTNLLLQARQRGVRLVTGATVLRLEPAGEAGWSVLLRYTDELLHEREPARPLRLVARQVVLAAGTLGSTEILLRSKQAGLALSDRLGHQFSGNGDVLALGLDAREPLRALADEAVAPAARQVGPTITAMLDARDAGGFGETSGFVVQDLAIPAGLRWSLEESFALAESLDALARPDDSKHRGGVDFEDPLSVRPQRGAHLLPVAIMGLDAALGRLRLPEPDDEDDEGEPGSLWVDWPEARRDPEVQRRHAWLEQRLQAQGAKLLANPLWRLLPADMEFLLGDQRGPMITVHPLGGCPMADDAARGVVDEWGQVFHGRTGKLVHPGLAVLDGAILPAALGINPALTITALSLRALDGLQRRWGLRDAAALPLPKPGPRPVYRVVDPEHAEPQLPTLVEVRERLGAFVRLDGRPCYLECTFVYEPLPVRRLLVAGPQRRLIGGPDCRLRLFEAAPDPDSPGRWMVVKAGSARGQGKLWMHAEPDDADALWVAPLEQASLAVFHRAASTPRQRRCRALKAWFMNRGWRDSWQSAIAYLNGNEAAKPGAPSAWQTVKSRARNALALASHGGQLRLMEYEMRVGAGCGAAGVPSLEGLRLQGLKRISYTRRGNPWKQLSRMRLENGPFEAIDGGGRPELELDLFYLERQRQPLLRITQAQDLPSAIRDIGSLLAYLLRLMIEVHVWTFRKPDAAPPREIRRLPEFVPGLPAPEVSEIATGRWGDAGASRAPVDRKRHQDDEQPVLVRLTRYRARGGVHGQPILMIHGYSASGTTFAHHSVQPGPAKLLWDAGFDVWVLDMRTSAGLPTAKLPWTFEECALNDIPVAIDQVLRATGRAQVDVLAHCMGSAMLHMALLQPQAQACEHFFPLRERLMKGGVIRRLVISQVTPLMIYSPTNTLRAYLMQWLRPYLPLDEYSFRPGGEQSAPLGLLDQLIDRLLASLPYPDEEFDLENPPFPSIRKTPWTATRHRMDLLYGRDFAIRNVDQPVFDFIDDHFGPLNMDTVAQAIHFARQHEISDWRGASLYLDDMAKSLAQLQAFPVLSVHGQDNGLCQAESGELTRDLYERVAPGRYRHVVVPEHGHQDCLIGRDLETKVFPAVIAFLQEGLQ